MKYINRVKRLEEHLSSMPVPSYLEKLTDEELRTYGKAMLLGYCVKLSTADYDAFVSDIQDCIGRGVDPPEVDEISKMECLFIELAKPGIHDRRSIADILAPLEEIRSGTEQGHALLKAAREVMRRYDEEEAKFMHR
ncbi:MAG TPA: hypothetical protein VN445_02405 [Rectinemataceae bacterium]|nr:hypothetical protein [Rectinemataceae bacterium]